MNSSTSDQLLKNRFRLLTTDELAERLNVEPRTIVLWRKDRRIPYVKLAHKTVGYDWERVRAALEGYEVKPITIAKRKG